MFSGVAQGWTKGSREVLAEFVGGISINSGRGCRLEVQPKIRWPIGSETALDTVLYVPMGEVSTEEGCRLYGCTIEVGPQREFGTRLGVASKGTRDRLTDGVWDRDDVAERGIEEEWPEVLSREVIDEV